MHDAVVTYFQSRQHQREAEAGEGAIDIKETPRLKLFEGGADINNKTHMMS